MVDDDTGKNKSKGSKYYNFDCNKSNLMIILGTDRQKPPPFPDIESNYDWKVHTDKNGRIFYHNHR